MKKKLKDFFNSLEALPEVINANFERDVRQLRSSFSQIKKDYPYARDELYGRVSKKVLKLQRIISDKKIIQGLRNIQSECDRLLNRQNIEHEEDFHAFCYDSTGWCGVEYENIY